MKVLLIGSSFSAVPFLSELRRVGAEVTVIGKHPTDPCHAFADASIYNDYSNADTLLEVCRKGAFDFIVPSCNDYSYVAGAQVAADLGFPGFDTPSTTAILHTKDKFRQFCEYTGISAPRIYCELSAEDAWQDALAAVDLPALVKPTDSFSGRGVQLVLTRDDLERAVSAAFTMSRAGRVVIEQYVEGNLHSHTAFVANGRIVWHDFVDEFCEVYAYQVDRSSYPSKLSSRLRGLVNEAMESLIRNLNICDGLLHTQFIASQSQFWIIETMRRCPGDLYGHHFKFSFGFDYEAQFVAGFLGRLPTGPVDAVEQKPIERRVLSVSEGHGFFGISIDPPVAQQMTFIPLKDSGQKIEAAPFDKAGILFLVGRSADQNRAPFPADVKLAFHGAT